MPSRRNAFTTAQHEPQSETPITNGHESSHQDAVSRLSIEQQNAIDLLIQDKPDHEVAAAVGVVRETVTRWRHENPYFVAELNRQRKALWGAAHERLRGLVHKAVDIVEKALEDGDLKAAVEVLKAVKLYGTVAPPSGLEDPELVLWQEAQAWAAAEVQRAGPAVDALQRLLDENAGKQVDLARQRMQALRQRWTLDR
jgi:hypothetical protein